MSPSNAGALAEAAAATEGEIEARQADLLAKARELDQRLADLQIRAAEQRSAIEAAL